MTDHPFGVSPSAKGPMITLKVVPGASRERIVGPYGDSLKLSVSEPPERGRANRAVLRLLSRILGVRDSDLEIVSGAGSSRKRVLIRSLSAEQVLARIQLSLEPQP